MDEVVSGAVSGISGVLGTLFIAKVLAVKNFISVSSTRRSAIRGVWRGEIHQTEIAGDDEPKNPIEIEIKNFLEIRNWKSGIYQKR